jgi:hypothetical protein
MPEVGVITSSCIATWGPILTVPLNHPAADSFMRTFTLVTTGLRALSGVQRIDVCPVGEGWSNSGTRKLQNPSPQVSSSPEGDDLQT